MVYAQAIGSVLAKAGRRFARTEAPGTKHDTIVQAVTRGDSTAVLKFLETNAVLLHMKDDLGTGLLHIAAANGHANVASVLIAHGIDVNALDATGATPLHLAVLGSPEAVVRLLIEAGADVNARTRRKMTALALARMFGRSAVANRIGAAGGTE